MLLDLNAWTPGFRWTCLLAASGVLSTARVAVGTPSMVPNIEKGYILRLRIVFYRKTKIWVGSTSNRSTTHLLVDVN